MADELAAAQAAINDYHQALERILKLHTAKHGRPVTCAHCKRPWPCPTARAALEPHTAGDAA